MDDDIAPRRDLLVGHHVVGRIDRPQHDILRRRGFDDLLRRAGAGPGVDPGIEVFQSARPGFGRGEARIGAELGTADHVHQPHRGGLGDGGDGDIFAVAGRVHVGDAGIHREVVGHAGLRTALGGGDRRLPFDHALDRLMQRRRDDAVPRGSAFRRACRSAVSALVAARVPAR